VIEWAEIQNLRGIRTGKIEKLSAINVIVGPNNSGKSTVLEGLLVLAAHDSLGQVVQYLTSRGGKPAAALGRAWGDATSPIVVRAGCTGSKQAGTVISTLTLVRVRSSGVTNTARAEQFAEPWAEVQAQARWDSPPTWGTTGIAIDSSGQQSAPTLVQGGVVKTPDVRFVGIGPANWLEDHLTVIEKGGGRAAIVDALRCSLPGIVDLRILKEAEQFVAHASFEKGPPLPLYVMGDGAKRLIAIAASIFGDIDATVLLEEPEAYQHPRYLREIVAMISTYASRGTQYVMTTHSIELLDMLLDETERRGANAPSLAIHRTKLIDGELFVTTLDASTARNLRHSLLEDLRG
jgi:energy-coupling factor transporter ATP-binding protein EcfA2